MAKLLTLLVFANPYLHLTDEGEPMCVVAWDPVGHNPDRGFVGATVKHEITRRFPAGDARQNEQRTWFEFSHEPQRLPDTGYYRQAIARGELIPADEATAKECGLPFVDPSEAIETAKQRAVARWTDHHGDPPENLTGHTFGPVHAAHARAKREAEDQAKAEADARKAADDAQAAADKAKAELEARAHPPRQGTIPPPRTPTFPPPRGGAQGGE